MVEFNDDEVVVIPRHMLVDAVFDENIWRGDVKTICNALMTYYNHMKAAEQRNYNQTKALQKIAAEYQLAPVDHRPDGSPSYDLNEIVTEAINAHRSVLRAVNAETQARKDLQSTHFKRSYWEGLYQSEHELAKQLSEDCADLKKRLTEAEDEVQQLRQDCGDMNCHIKELATDCNTANQLLAEAKQEIERLRKGAALIEQGMAASQDTSPAVREEIQRLQVWMAQCMEHGTANTPWGVMPINVETIYQIIEKYQTLEQKYTNLLNNAKRAKDLLEAEII